MRAGLIAGLLAMLAMNVAADDDLPPSILVQASGTISRAPDQAVVQMAVETVAKTASEAARENAAKMNLLLEALTKKADIPKRQIRTTAYDLSPRYDHGNRRKPNPDPIGYQAHNMMMVTVDAVDQVGRVIDLAIEAGANRIAGVRFQVKDVEGAYREALQVAVHAAKERAETLAFASGHLLGSPLEIGASQHGPAPAFKMMRAESMAMGNTPIEGGQIDVTAQVTVRYAIGEPSSP